MSDDLANAITIVAAIVLLVAVPLNGYVALLTAKAAWRKPAITSLNLAVLSRSTRFLASLAFAGLGVLSLHYLQTGERLLPPPWPTLLIVFGAVIISTPSPADIRAIRTWRREIEELRGNHRRIGDARDHLHRRRDDVPPGDGL